MNITASVDQANSVFAGDITQTYPADSLEDRLEYGTLCNSTNVWTSLFRIEGMHCFGCSIIIEKSLNCIPGVMDVQVNAAGGRARVAWKPELTQPAALMAAVRSAGYTAIPAIGALLDNTRRQDQRSALWRLLVAGFCMMQVMMYAFPAYIANPGEMTPDMQNLLRWASWLLTLPVMLFACAPFFSNALNDIKYRRISMELPVALGMFISFMVSTAATFQPYSWWGHEVYFDSLTMFVFFLLTGRWIELRLRDRTAGALEAIMQRLPNRIERCNANGSVSQVAPHRLNVGDTLNILPGQAFPADGIILVGNTSADEALLTGESRPVAKWAGSDVIAGSHNLAAAVQMRVEKIGQATRYAQIVALMELAAAGKPRLALLADRIARPFLLAVLFAAALSAAYLWHVDHSRALMAAVAVLIVTCPCALSLATPAAMLTVSGALARSGVLVRRMQGLEALTMIDTVIFDKTGTLTEDRLVLGNVYVNPGQHEPVLTEALALHIAASLAKFSLHPVARAIVAAALQRPVCDLDIKINRLKEIAGFGLEADSIFGRLKLGSALFCQVDTESMEAATGKASLVHLVSKHGRLASFQLKEAIKADAFATVSALSKQGLAVEIMSGDTLKSVNTVAAQLGIHNATGGNTPQDKLGRVHTLKQQGRKVLMVGDGLNDGPVLASAHVSIAMGQAVPLAQAQSDFVILSGELAMVPQLINQAKRTMRIVKQNLAWAAAYNAICVPLAIAGMLPAWLAGLGMALSSLVVILNAARLSHPFPTLLQR